MTDTPDVIDVASAPIGLDPGRIVSQSFGIYFQNFIPFTLIMFLASAPVFIWALLLTSGLSTDDSVMATQKSIGYFEIGSSLLGFVLQPIATGAIIYGVFKQLQGGGRVSAGKCLSVGLSKLFPVLGVSILMGLIVLGGMILLVIPGIILAMGLYVAVPIAVVEQKSVSEAIHGSFALTKGNRWKIFAVAFVVGIIGGVIGFILQKVAIDQSSFEALISSVKVYLIANFALSLVFSAVGAVTSALVYYQLKVQSEGVDADELARVFE